MKRSNFQLIGYIGTALGIFFLIGGLIASVYYKEYHTGESVDYIVREYLYQKYAVILFVAGVVLLVVGLAFRSIDQDKSGTANTERNTLGLFGHFFYGVLSSL